MTSTPKGTQLLFGRAAKSIVAAGLEETVDAVLQARILRPYSEGILQYLAIRLGGLDKGEQALADLRLRVGVVPGPELLEYPGPRARLYRMAREHASPEQSEALRPPSTVSRAALPWRSPPQAAGSLYAEALARIRNQVDEEAAELLELRYARELDLAELAFVVGGDLDEVKSRLDAAEGQAQKILADTSAQPAIALLEAYALDTSRKASEGAGDGKATLVEGAVLGGRYAIEKRVGAGSFGEVYRANDTEVPGHVVGLKILHQAATSEMARQMALRELHLIASVFHPSVVQLKDHGWHQDRLWFVMPWYEGETLEERIRRGPLSREEARATFERLARALATMHESGIRHQDVKPDNIFLARIRGFGHGPDQAVLPVLIDLGVAAKEAEMVLAGTPNYFAPEVAAQFAKIRGADLVTTKADVFSLALSLRNALEPEAQEDVAAGAVESFIEHRAKKPPAPPSGKDLQFLKPHFERWLALDQDRRPTADELAEELKVLTRPEVRRERRARLLRWAVPLAIALLAVFGSVVFALSRQAKLQALEAERARSEAALVREDLSRVQQRRKALEVDVAQARERYESSALTRQQLAGELAKVEGERTILREELSGEQARSRFLRSKLSDSETTLGATRSDLESERAATKELRERLTATRSELAGALDRARGAEEQVTALNQEVEAGRGEIAAAKALSDERARSLAAAERGLASARTELATARRELATAQRRVALLERQLAASETARRRAEEAARRRPTPVPRPTPQPSAPPAPEAGQPKALRRPPSLPSSGQPRPATTTRR